MNSPKSRAPLGDLKPGIYFVTGKGGVGKSFVSSLLGAYLNKQARVVRLSTEWVRSGPNLDSRVQNQQWNLQENIEQFLAKSKQTGLGSFFSKGMRSISSNAVFKSFVDAIPGFYEISILGRLLHQWKQSQDQCILVDSFSTGHFMQMLQTPLRFQKLPLSGVIKQEIEGVSEYLLLGENLNVLAVANPETVIIEETQELKSQLLEFNPKTNVQVIANKVFTEDITYNSKELNSLADHRRHMTAALLQEFYADLALSIPVVPGLMSSCWGDLKEVVDGP